MIIGRWFGWLLLAVTVVMASADAVLALGPGEYVGIATIEVLTLLLGGAPHASGAGYSVLGAIEAVLLNMPAWVMVGLTGTVLVVACRKRNRRYKFRR